MVEPVEAALVVERVERQLVGAGREQPSQPALDAGAGLVEVRDRRGDKLTVYLVEEPVEVAGALRDIAGQRSGRDRRAQPVGKQLGGAPVGQVLPRDQVQRERPHPGSVLRRRRHAGREVRRGQLPAAAAASFDDMLGHVQPDLGQLEQLPPLATLNRRVLETGAAARAARRRVPDDLVRVGDRRQRPAPVTGLPARLTARRAAKAFRRGRLRQPVRRRRPRRVTRVRAQLPLELGNLTLQLRHPNVEPPNRRRLLNDKLRKLLRRRPARGHKNKFDILGEVPSPPEQSRSGGHSQPSIGQSRPGSAVDPGSPGSTDLRDAGRSAGPPGRGCERGGADRQPGRPARTPKRSGRVQARNRAGTGRLAGLVSQLRLEGANRAPAGVRVWPTARGARERTWEARGERPALFARTVRRAARAALDRRAPRRRRSAARGRDRLPRHLLPLPAGDRADGRRGNRRPLDGHARGRRLAAREGDAALGPRALGAALAAARCDGGLLDARPARRRRARLGRERDDGRDPRRLEPRLGRRRGATVPAREGARHRARRRRRRRRRGLARGDDRRAHDRLGRAPPRRRPRQHLGRLGARARAPAPPVRGRRPLPLPLRPVG